MPTLFTQLKTARDHEPEPPGSPVTSVSSRRSSISKMGVSRTSQVRVEVRREFLKTTNKGTRDEAYTNPESLPSLEVAFDTFKLVYPKFAETFAVDDLREQEYYHLEESQHVCMDYCGFGLFSYQQQVTNKASASFGLAYISANLPTHALYGAADEGTVEYCMRKRVMDYLNINETEYSMVFTASRGSAFKLLAESYPFHLNQKLLTVYDFESEAVNWMAECAKQKGAKIMSACFKWPSLRIGTSDLKKQLQEKKRKGETAKGLFVFPVQSRMTGAKYSYQWMSQAQQNKWHVLLDASALGPKDMDSLGLSLFRPDFIVSSFYKIFGTDPTGFGCLFIKNSAIQSLHNSSRARAVGMVRIVSSNNHGADGTSVKDSEDDDGEEGLPNNGNERLKQPMQSTISFSGPYFKASDVDLKIVDLPKGRKQRAPKSWRRNGKMEPDAEQPGTSTASTSLRGRDNEIQEGPSDTEYGTQLTKSRYYSEKRAIEIEDLVGGTELGQLSRTGNEWRANEIQSIGDAGDSDNGISGEFECSDMPWLGSVNETGEDELVGTQKLQDFTDQDVRNIEEEGAEHQELAEVCESSTTIRTGDDDSPVFDHDESPHGGSGDNEAGGGDLAWTKVISSIEADEPMEMISWAVSSNKDLPRRASLDGNGPKTGPTDLFPRGQNRALKNVSTADAARESKQNSITVLEGNCIVQQTEELTSSSLGEKADRPKFKESRFKSFEGTASFRRLTGKELSDFQEMGVLGLVQRFQSLHGGSGDFDNELMEVISEEREGPPLHERDGSVETDVVLPDPPSFTTKSDGNRSHTSNIELGGEEADSASINSEVKSNFEFGVPASGSPVRFNLPDIVGRGCASKGSLGGGGSETVNVNLISDLIEGAEETWSGHDDDCESLNRGECTYVETEKRDRNESLELAACPACEILPECTVVDATYNEDDYLALQHRLAAVRERERERALHGTNHTQLRASPASIVGGDEDWSQDEEFPQEHPISIFPRPSGDGEIDPSSGRVESHVVDHETGVFYLSKDEKSGAPEPSATRVASFSFSHDNSGAIAYRQRDYDFDERVANELVLWRGQEKRSSISTGSASDTASTLREDEPESSRQLNSEHLPTPVNVTHSLQTSITFRLDGGGTPYESGEENYITILPHSRGKRWSNTIPETVNEVRTFGSQEVSDDENRAVIMKDMGKIEGRTVVDVVSDVERNHEVDHVKDSSPTEDKNHQAGQVERSFKFSRQSPTIESQSSLPSLPAPLQIIASPCRTTSNINHIKGRSIEDASFDTADFHDATEMAWKSGRSDLRSSRTLSRDVDFDGDIYSARASSVSDRFLSGRSTTLAEDIAQIDLQGSDEDSLFQSRYYDESLHGSSTSRYFADEVPSSSYPEDDSDEELDHIQGAEGRKRSNGADTLVHGP